MPFFWKRQPRQQEQVQAAPTVETVVTNDVTQNFYGDSDDEMATAIHEFDEPSVSSRPPRMPSPPPRQNRQSERSRNRATYDTYDGARKMERSSLSRSGRSVDYSQRPDYAHSRGSGPSVASDGVSSYNSATSYGGSSMYSRHGSSSAPRRYNHDYTEGDTDSTYYSTASRTDMTASSYVPSTYLDGHPSYHHDRHSRHQRSNRCRSSRHNHHHYDAASTCMTEYYPESRCSCADGSTVVSSSSCNSCCRGGSTCSAAGDSSSFSCCCCHESGDKRISTSCSVPATRTTVPTPAGAVTEPTKKITTTIQTITYDSAGNPCGTTTTTTTNDSESDLASTHAALAAAHRAGGALFPTGMPVGSPPAGFARPADRGTGSMPMTINGVPVVVPVSAQGTSFRPASGNRPVLAAGASPAGYGPSPSQQQWFY